MTIKFLHTPIEQIDRVCREEDCVKVRVEIYRRRRRNHQIYDDDGSSELVQTYGWGQTIKSSKDLIQFDDEDMKVLSRKVKHQLR